MRYHKIKNSFFNSNTYIIEKGNKQIIIIDPGNPDTKALINVVKENEWQIEGVILTHEHADHIAGLLGLYNLKPFPVYCSKACSVNIRSGKHNLSKYIEDIDTFELDIPTQIIQDRKKVKIGEFDFLFIETPGHSPGSACIFTEDSVFVGDTILNKKKVPLNLPHSNRLLYSYSIKKLEKLIKPGIKIYPGHGEPLVFETWSQFEL